MCDAIDFSLKRSGYSARRLTQKDADVLQRLYEQCKAFFLLTDGLAPLPTAAHDEFDDLPAGKETEDIFIFGLFDADDVLLGMISAVRHCPDPQTWWIGLMMLVPERRGQGLGADFYTAFRRWVAAQGASRISLSAIAPNKPGLKFWKSMGFEVTRKIPSRQFKAKTHLVYVLSHATGI
ncbi:MAG: GNAT family N-acetyltransferase [Phormidesmis sp.]